MESKIELNIIVATDKTYLILLAALVKSIELNYHGDQTIHFFILADNISDNNKKKLTKSIHTPKIDFVWIDLDYINLYKIDIPIDRTSYPQNIYMRLLIPYLLGDHINKILYLDVDMLVLTDIQAIFEIELGNNIVAAVIDPRVKCFANKWGGVLNYKSLGLRGDLPYFNSGLLLIDLQKWRDFNVTKKVIDCINQNKKYAQYPDQYGLNVVLPFKWKSIDPLWNYYSDGSEADPKIIHFIGRKPIYPSYKGNILFQQLFYRYLNQTLWINSPKVPEWSRVIKKLTNVFDKYFKRSSK